MLVYSSTLLKIMANERIENECLLETLLIRLYETNSLQWKMENVVRKIELSDKERVKAKEEIDMLNMQRVSIIEQIDEYIFERLQQNSCGVPHTETPGQLYDRVIVSLIKKKEIANRQEVFKKDAARIRLDIFSKQVDYLLFAMDSYFDQLLNKEIYFMLFKQMKIYE